MRNIKLRLLSNFIAGGFLLLAPLVLQAQVFDWDEVGNGSTYADNEDVDEGAAGCTEPCVHTGLDEDIFDISDMFSVDIEWNEIGTLAGTTTYGADIVSWQIPTGTAPATGAFGGNTTDAYIALGWNNDWDEPTDGVLLSFTFSEPIFGLRYQILDVDEAEVGKPGADPWDDVISTLASTVDVNGNLLPDVFLSTNPNFYTLGSCVNVSNELVSEGYANDNRGFEGVGDPTDPGTGPLEDVDSPPACATPGVNIPGSSAEANVTLTLNSPDPAAPVPLRVTKLSVDYRTGNDIGSTIQNAFPTQNHNPNGQRVGFTNILFPLVSGHVYQDNNSNGTEDGGDVDLQNVDVFLCAVPNATSPCDPLDAAYLRTVTTDANGDWVGNTTADDVEAVIDISTLPATLDPAGIEGDVVSTSTAIAGSNEFSEKDGFAPLAGICQAYHVTFDDYPLATATSTKIFDSEYATVGADNTSSPLPPGAGFTISGVERPTFTNHVTAYNTNTGTGGRDLDLEFSNTGNGLIVQEIENPPGTPNPLTGTGDGGYLPDDNVGDTITFDFEGVLNQFSLTLLDFENDAQLVFIDNSPGAVVSSAAVTFADLVIGSGSIHEQGAASGCTPADDSVCVMDNPITALELGMLKFDEVVVDQSGDPLAMPPRVATSGGIDNIFFNVCVTSTVGDKVWLDEDEDGLYDKEEAGITGVTVQLINSDAVVVATTVTDAHGNYLFSNVVPDTYTVNVVVGPELDGLIKTAGPFGTDGDPRTVVVNLGDHIDDADFGYIPVADTGTIGDRVWSDANGNGIQDPGEAGIFGVVLELQDGICIPMPTPTPPGVSCPTVTTNANGDYLFRNVPFGEDYVVSISPADTVLNNGGYLPAVLMAPGGPTSGPQSEGALVSHPITLNAALQTVTDVDFGFDTPATLNTISDTVWFDENGDGIFDAGEAAIANVSINIVDDATGAIIATAFTDAMGVVSFSGLLDGTYRFEITDVNALLPGLFGTTPEAIATVSDPVTVTGGGINPTEESFGYNLPGLIAGTVYSDADSSSDQEANEVGFVGVPVFLCSSPVAAPPCDPSDPEFLAQTTTAFDGSYAFTGQPAGSYRVDITPPTLTQTEDPDATVDDGTTITLASGESSAANDFGYVDATHYPISGTVFLDTDKDGVEEPLGKDGLPGTLDDELGIPGVTLELIDVISGNVIATTTADADGNYFFPGLPNGNYQVRVTDDNALLSGYDITSGLDILPVTVAGAPVADVDFGYVKDEATGSISGEVFIDELSGGPPPAYNNMADDEEVNLSGVTLYLCSSPVAADPCDPGDDEYIGMTTSDANGEYGFNGLPPGEYVVDANPATLPGTPGDLTLSVDPDPVALSEGEDVTDVDVGYIPQANSGVLSGFVWVDANGNGVHDPGEAPIPGLQIFVYDSLGTVAPGSQLLTATTQADGTWIITGIAPTVLRDNFLVTYDDEPGSPGLAILSGLGLMNSQPTNLPMGDDLYLPVDLLDDVTNDDGVIGYLDFGFQPATDILGSIAGTIYSDNDNPLDMPGVNYGNFNPAPGGPDEGLAGVTLDLVLGGVVIASTVTDADGNYSFTGLADGSYMVVVSDHGNVLQDLNPEELIPDPIVLLANPMDPTQNVITGADAGYITDPDLGSIGSFFWLDTSGDGLRQDGEPGIGGVTVQCWLDNPPLQTPPNDPLQTYAAPIPGQDNLIRTEVTDEAGEYLCTSLPAGQYIVVVVTDAITGENTIGFEEGADGTMVTGSTAFEAAKPWTYVVTKTAMNPANRNANFGVAGANTLSGSVFIEDIDLEDASTPFDAGGGVGGVEDGGKLDGLFDTVNDVAAEGVKVELFVLKPNGSYKKVQTTTTDASGNYSFTGLPDGMYRVVVKPNGSPIDGFGQTADPDIADTVANPNPYPSNVCDSATAADCDDQTGTPIDLNAANPNATGINFGYQKGFVTTPVTVNQFTAVSTGGGVEFNWESSNEVGHVGYQLYARTADGWVLLTEEPIRHSDSSDALATRSYQFTAYNVDARWFALVDVSTAEELTLHGPFKLDRAYGGAMQEPAEFDWSEVRLDVPDKARVSESVQRRLRDALQFDDGVEGDAEGDFEDEFESDAVDAGADPAVTRSEQTGEQQ